MKLSNNLLMVCLVTAGCLFSTALPAQDTGEGLATLEELPQAPVLYTNEVELGAGYVDNGSYKFGEYNGLENQGPFGIANIMIRKYLAPGQGDQPYWQLDGRNLGLADRSVNAEYDQGHSFSLMLNYDEIPHNRFDDGRTPFLGAGTANQTLPSNWIGANSTSGLTKLFPDLKYADVQTERKRFGGGFTWNLTDKWHLNGTYRHEIKDGEDALGAAFGTTGGDPRSSILIRPINYDTDEFNVTAGYTGEKGQYSLNYHLSLFNNSDNYLMWTNPFNGPSSWDPGANFSDGARGRMSSEPDNKAWQVNLAGGYDLGMMTRVTGNFSYGQMTQNQAFIPYSSVFPAAVALPRSSLDGRIDTIFVNLGVSSRLTNKIGLVGRYTYDDRDNKTPRAVYQPVPQDSAAQDPLMDEGTRFNLPYSYRHHDVQLDLNYNLMMNSRLTVGYEYENIHRNYTEVENTSEHTGKIRLTFNPFSSAGFWVSYQHSARRGSTYVSNQPLLSSLNPAYLNFVIANSPDDLYSNDPLMRKYHIADRNRDQFAAEADYAPNDVLVFTVSGAYNRDDFINTQDGLQKSINGNVTLDGSYTPNKKISFNAYVTYENYDYKQRGFYHPGFLGPLTPTTDRIAVFGDNWWTMDSNDKIYSGGASVNWNVIQDKFTLKLDFLASHARTNITPRSSLAYLPIPDVKTDLYRLTLNGEYKIKPNMGVRFMYWYESFDTSDFAHDLVTPDTLANVILLGNGTPNYKDNVVAISWFYKWQ